MYFGSLGLEPGLHCDIPAEKSALRERIDAEDQEISEWASDLHTERKNGCRTCSRAENTL
jgi:hypothetical protein